MRFSLPHFTAVTFLWFLLSVVCSLSAPSPAVASASPTAPSPSPPSPSPSPSSSSSSVGPRCRACVSLVSVFQAEALGPARRLRRRLMGRRPKDGAAAWVAGDTAAAHSAARQRLVADLHGAIDGLCARVRRREGRAAGEAVCEETLAELAETLEDIAFREVAEARETKETESRRREVTLPLRAAETREDEGDDDARNFTDACRICEEQEFCTSDLVDILINEERLKQEMLDKKSVTSLWSENIFSLHWWQKKYVELLNGSSEDLNNVVKQWFMIFSIVVFIVGSLLLFVSLHFLRTQKQSAKQTNIDVVPKKNK